MVVKDGKITESKYDNVNENGESKQKMQNTTKTWKQNLAQTQKNTFLS